ncbi:transcriptional regulator, MarR family, partial [mine drainage metagenome]
MPDRSASRVAGARGLAALRRLGAVSDLLFLYEAETRSIPHLREIADRLGLSVQAASHSFRSLRRRGLAEFRDGRYRPTVRGVDWLHAALGGVRDDLAERLDRLHIVRTTRAIAGAPVAQGEIVSLEIVDGILTARPGAGAGSRGRAQDPAGAGELVEVGEL